MKSINYQDLLRQCQNITTVPYELARQAIRKLVKQACGSQNAGKILIAREFLSELKSEWLCIQLPDAIACEVDLRDEWEFRRLIELLYLVAPTLLDRYLDEALMSECIDIIEAANDMQSLSIRARSSVFLFQIYDVIDVGRDVGLLPGVPEGFFRNRLDGLLIHGSILEIDTRDGTTHEFTVEGSCNRTRETTVDGVTLSRLFVVPVVKRQQLDPKGAEVFLKLSSAVGGNAGT